MVRCIARKSVCCLVVCVLTTTVLAAPTAEQRRELNALLTQIRKAGTLYSQAKYLESGEVVKEVLGRAEKLLDDADGDLSGLVDPVYKRIVRAHALLELEGIELPSLKKLDTATKPRPMPTTSDGVVEFTRQVAPLLVARCGRCHVNASRGEFSMATYAALMRGSSAGVVIFPGDAKGSRVVEVIEEGEMPRGGGRVSPAELNTLKQWIQQGAKFDGENQQADLNALAAIAATGGRQAIAVTRSSGSESVSFARDIAPVLGTSCVGCHVNARRPRGRLNLSNFAGLVEGGESGPPVLPRDPANSIMMQRIRGAGDQPRMPAGGRPRLADEVIAKFEKWISEGARFDGPDPRQNVIQLAALAKARTSTHEELSAERVQLAAQNWRLGMGSMPFAKSETKNFYLLGNVGPSALEECSKRAESLAPQVASMLGASPEGVLLKGRMTLFLFNQRYDYSEFGQMVEKRQLPNEWRGHWRYTIVEAYGALIPPRDDEHMLDGLVGQQVAGLYVASLGSPPRWFSEGSARAIAARLAPSDVRVAGWDNALPGVLGSMSQPDDFVKGRLPPEDADIASYSYVRFLMKDSRRFTSLLTNLGNGQSFDRSFAAVYGANPSRIAQLWIQNAISQSGRRRR